MSKRCNKICGESCPIYRKCLRGWWHRMGRRWFAITLFLDLFWREHPCGECRIGIRTAWEVAQGSWPKREVPPC